MITNNFDWYIFTNFTSFQSQLTEKSEGLPGLEDIGVELHKVGDKMPWELDFYRAFKYHEFRREADKPIIHPLNAITGMEENQLEAKNSQAKNITKLFGL